MKKLLTLLLSALMLFSVLAGCSDGVEDDEVVLTVAGQEYTKEEFTNWMKYIAAQYEAENGEVADWKAEMGEGMTYADYMKEYTISGIEYYRAVECIAEDLGVTLSLEDTEAVQQTWDDGVAQYGSESAFVASLEASGMTADMYRYMLNITYLYNGCYEKQFGERGANVSEEDILEYLGDTTYYTAKHILIKTVDADGNELSQGEKDKAYALAQDVLNKLVDYSGDDFEAYFDELMAEHNEDEGVEMFPNGYLFTEGEMTSAFEDAVIDLEENEFSGIVESSYGYHIILRLPLNVDLVPISQSAYAYYGYDYTLRYLVTTQMFDANIDSYRDGIEITKADAFDKIDAAKILK